MHSGVKKGFYQKKSTVKSCEFGRKVFFTQLNCANFFSLIKKFHNVNLYSKKKEERRGEERRGEEKERNTIVSYNYGNT
jgi:hypothetical protein